MNFYDNQSFMSQADGFLKAVSSPGLARDILIYLNSHPMGEYTPLQLSEQLLADYDEVTKILKKLSESKNLKSIPLTNQAKARSMKEAMQTSYYHISTTNDVIGLESAVALKNAYAGDFITLYGLTESEIQSLKLPCEALPGGWRVAVRDTAAATEMILRRPELFRDYEITKGRMDDVFLAVTGRTLTGGAEK